MRRLLFIIIFLFLIVTNTYALETNIRSHMKGDTQVAVCNGHYWNSLDVPSKSAYIMAFAEGAWSYGLTLTTLHDEKVSKEERLRLDKAVSSTLISDTKMDVGGYISFFDKFYSQPLNIDIPINFALIVLNSQQRGVNVDEMIRLLRENSETVGN